MRGFCLHALKKDPMFKFTLAGFSHSMKVTPALGVFIYRLFFWVPLVRGSRNVFGME